MTEDERTCFQYGKEAAATGIRDPCDDRKMDRMTDRVRTGSEGIRNTRNMTAWYMGRLCQELEQGRALDRERFQLYLALLLPEAKRSAIPVWADFAQECVEQEQYVDFAHEPGEAPLCRWHETTLAGLILLTRKYDRETAVKVCDLGLEPCCLYPYEMDCAAEELRNGTSPEKISQMILEDGLDSGDIKFPKLRDVFQPYEQSQTASMDMSL